MYLLDWLTPKRLKEPIDLLYDMWTQELETQANQDKMYKAVSCLVYNMCYWIQYGVDEIEVTLHKNVYSKPLTYNCNKVNRKVSWKYSTELFTWLHKKELATLKVGYVESWDVSNGVVKPAKRNRSSLQLSPELVGMLLPPKHKEPIKRLQSVIEVRGEDGSTLHRRIDEKQKEIIKTLEQYNLNIMDCVVELEGKRYMVQAKKVYNLDFNHGGRTYMTGSMVTGELLKKDKRGKIMIDGQPTTTLDYKHLHPSILAVEMGVVFRDGFDPYCIQIEGYEPTALRKIAKVALLCMINASSEKSAACGLSWDLFDKIKDLQELKDSGKIPPVVGVKEVMTRLKEHNKYAEDYFYSGYGLTLQNKDSKIIDYIMNYWNQRGVTLIPLHDSVTIQSQHVAECLVVMKDAYKYVLGTLDNCFIEIG